MKSIFVVSYRVWIIAVRVSDGRFFLIQGIRGSVSGPPEKPHGSGSLFHAFVATDLIGGSHSNALSFKLPSPMLLRNLPS